MKTTLETFQKNDVVCVEGEQNYDLFIIKKGQLLICISKGSEVTPLAYLGEGEFLGELSFFDQKNRSAHVIAMEETELVRIPHDGLKGQFPDWLLTMAQGLTKRLRHMNDIVQKAGLKRKNVDTIEPLSFDEQREIFQCIENKRNQ